MIRYQVIRQSGEFLFHISLNICFFYSLFSSVCCCFTAVLLKVFHLAFYLFYSRLIAFVVWFPMAYFAPFPYRNDGFHSLRNHIKNDRNMEQTNQLISTAEAAKFLGIKVAIFTSWWCDASYLTTSPTANCASWQSRTGGMDEECTRGIAGGTRPTNTEVHHQPF